VTPEDGVVVVNLKEMVPIMENLDLFKMSLITTENFQELIMQEMSNI